MGTTKLTPGCVLGNVRLSRRIGGGAMGSVWLAEHLTLATDVAVKFISEGDKRTDPDTLARFLREAALAAKIKSPHVVQMYDRGATDDGTPYIVMELLEGETLGQRIRREGALPVREAAEVVVQVSKALGKAHELGIVHRDIKPDNIFLSEDDAGLLCKVLDFGIAKQTQTLQIDGLTVQGAIVGTPEFMSPEQLLNAAEADPRADLWALAVVAYVCLTGRKPFTGETIGKLCASLLAANYPAPSQIRAEVPVGLDAWFRQALAKQPEERFGGARAMAVAFAKALGEDGEDLARSLRTSGRRPRSRPGRGMSTTQSGSGSRSGAAGRTLSSDGKTTRSDPDGRTRSSAGGRVGHDDRTIDSGERSGAARNAAAEPPSTSDTLQASHAVLAERLARKPRAALFVTFGTVGAAALFAVVVLAVRAGSRDGGAAGASDATAHESAGLPAHAAPAQPSAAPTRASASAVVDASAPPAASAAAPKSTLDRGHARPGVATRASASEPAAPHRPTDDAPPAPPAEAATKPAPAKPKPRSSEVDYDHGF
jgi:serine/threonine-protein kinase